MPVQYVSPSDLIRQKRLVIDSSVTQKVKAGNIAHRTSTISPIKITAVTSPKFTQTISQNNFTTGKSSNPGQAKKL